MASIYERIALVMTEVANVPKTGENTFDHYKYASDSDIVGAVHAAMAKHGVTMHCAEAVVIEQKDVDTAKGGKASLCRWSFRWRFACGTEPNEFIDVWMPSEAMDRGDKAYYKAITGSKKYALLTTFVLETGADAEVESIERGHSAPPVQQRTPARQPARPQPSAPATSPRAGNGPISEKQYALIQKLAREYDDLREQSGNSPQDWKAYKQSYGKESFKQFSAAEASEVIESIQKMKQAWVDQAPPADEFPPTTAYDDASIDEMEKAGL